MTEAQLSAEAKKATEMLKGKIVKEVWLHRPGEVGIEFEDGTRFFADLKKDGLELSITGTES